MLAARERKAGRKMRRRNLSSCRRLFVSSYRRIVLLELYPALSYRQTHHIIWKKDISMILEEALRELTLFVQKSGSDQKSGQQTQKKDSLLDSAVFEFAKSLQTTIVDLKRFIHQKQSPKEKLLPNKLAAWLHLQCLKLDAKFHRLSTQMQASSQGQASSQMRAIQTLYQNAKPALQNCLNSLYGSTLVNLTEIIYAQSMEMGTLRYDPKSPTLFWDKVKPKLQALAEIAKNILWETQTAALCSLQKSLSTRDQEMLEQEVWDSLESCYQLLFMDFSSEANMILKLRAQIRLNTLCHTFNVTALQMYNPQHNPLVPLYGEYCHFCIFKWGEKLKRDLKHIKENRMLEQSEILNFVQSALSPFAQEKFGPTLPLQALYTGHPLPLDEDAFTFKKHILDFLDLGAPHISKTPCDARELMKDVMAVFKTKPSETLPSVTVVEVILTTINPERYTPHAIGFAEIRLKNEIVYGFIDPEHGEFIFQDQKLFSEWLHAFFERQHYNHLFNGYEVQRIDPSIEAFMAVEDLKAKRPLFPSAVQSIGALEANGFPLTRELKSRREVAQQSFCTTKSAKPMGKTKSPQSVPTLHPEKPIIRQNNIPQNNNRTGKSKNTRMSTR